MKEKMKKIQECFQKKYEITYVFMITLFVLLLFPSFFFPPFKDEHQRQSLPSCLSCYMQNQSPRRVLLKRCSQKFRKIHRKTPVPESLFNNAYNFIQIETLPQVFSCEFCQIPKKTFFTEQLCFCKIYKHEVLLLEGNVANGQMLLTTLLVRLHIQYSYLDTFSTFQS